MSMLAERRRKQKWALDPRNTAWSNDDSKFGQRMLEKMGWSKGKGLGAQEQGATEHIKVQVKNNHLGLGASVNNEDNWIAHQDDFNQLLADLSSHHGQVIADSPDNKEKKSFSLEEKSKISKSRVHYMKFTKGKDLSSRSKTDLDCIFGKRQSKKIPAEDDSSPSTPDETENSTTTTSAFTIQEYFANRMAALKSRPLAAEICVEKKKAKNGKKEDKNAESWEYQPQVRKKRDLQQPEDTCGDKNAKIPDDKEDCVSEDPALPPKPKKKKEKKRVQEQAQATAEVTVEEIIVKKKKKKKEKKKKKNGSK